MTKTNPTKLLIVEDERTLASALATKFGKNGFACEECYDGACAITMLREQHFDAVLLDILLPEKDGYAVLESVKGGKNETTPVYVLTALGQEEKLDRAKKLGAKRCYVKSLTSIADVMTEIQKDLQMA